jgi:hypothetical protein
MKSARDQNGPNYISSNAASVQVIPGDCDTDADGFPWLVPEPRFSSQACLRYNVLDEDASAFTNQEVDIYIRNETDLRSLTCMGGINPTVLDPFQTIGTSPLPLNLVSSANKYCEFQLISIVTSTDMHHKLYQYCGPA